MSLKDHRAIQKLVSIWKSDKEKRFLKWTSIVLWVASIAILIAWIIIFFIVSRSDLPGFEELENPQYDLASIIIDANGEAFGKYYIENREFIDFDDLSPKVSQALLSVEDSRYHRHSGIDFRALLRVAVKSLILGQSSSGGGSTISQQLAKLLFKRSSLTGKNFIGRAVALANIKFKEWVTAVRLERRYTKEEIIAMYLNKFEFINGAHGVQSASQIYFGKDQKELAFEEAAVLIGMLKNPARYNPIRFPERTEARRNVVLRMMNVHDIISDSMLDSLRSSPINMVNFNRSTQSEGIAPYFRSELTKFLRPLLLKQENHKPEGGPYDIYRDGLRIYTTIDSRYQQYAEESVREHLKNLQRTYWRVWGNKDPIKFEAKEGQENLRNESVDRRIRETDLYKGLFLKVFGDLDRRSEERFGLALKEPTIRRLINNPSYVNSIDEDKKDSFNQLMRSNMWSEIRSGWSRFMAEVEREFSVVKDVKLFAYDDPGFEIKTMSLRDSVIHHLRHLQAGLLSIDPKTGEIKAWVGGADHRYFKYDHVSMRRQVGSTIKPFVYVTAMSVLGLPPCEQFSDIQYTIAPGDADFKVDSEWSPSNANGLFTQNKYNLYQGLLYSKNSITVRIVKELGTVEPIRDLLDRAGIDKYERINEGRYVVPEVPSLCLGSVDLSLLEMVGAYTTFANDGVFTQPTFISRIENKNGKVIYQSSRLQRRAINSLYNAVLVDMLKNNISGGFSMGLKGVHGGKTGTTNDYADGWFMGISPNLVSGIWVGGDEKWVRFFTLDQGQGFVMARPIYQKYLQKIEMDESLNFDIEARFAPPPPGYRNLTDCSRYKQGNPEDETEQRLQEQLEFDEFVDEFDDDLDTFESPLQSDTLQIFLQY